MLELRGCELTTPRTIVPARPGGAFAMTNLLTTATPRTPSTNRTWTMWIEAMREGILKLCVR